MFYVFNSNERLMSAHETASEARAACGLSGWYITGDRGTTRDECLQIARYLARREAAEQKEQGVTR